MECRLCDVSSWCLFIPKCYTITKKWELLPRSYVITSKFGKIKQEISKPCNEFFLSITFLHLYWDTQIYINKSLLISIEFKLQMQILNEIPLENFFNTLTKIFQLTTFISHVPVAKMQPPIFLSFQPFQNNYYLQLKNASHCKNFIFIKDKKPTTCTVLDGIFIIFFPSWLWI